MTLDLLCDRGIAGPWRSTTARQPKRSVDALRENPIWSRLNNKKKLEWFFSGGVFVVFYFASFLTRIVYGVIAREGKLAAAFEWRVTACEK